MVSHAAVSPKKNMHCLHVGGGEAKARAFSPPKMDGYIFVFFLRFEDFSAGGGIFVVAFFVPFLRIADSGAMLEFPHFFWGGLGTDLWGKNIYLMVGMPHLG